MRTDKICKNAINEAVVAVRNAEKAALDTDYSGKLDLIKDLTEVEKRLITIADCVAVEPFKITEETEVLELYQEGLLTVRTLNVCRRAGLYQLKDICELTEEKFKTVRCLGKRSVDEVKKIMKEHDMQFATEDGE